VFRCVTVFACYSSFSINYFRNNKKRHIEKAKQKKEHTIAKNTQSRMSCALSRDYLLCDGEPPYADADADATPGWEDGPNLIVGVSFFQKGDDQCAVRFFQKGDDQCPVSFFQKGDDQCPVRFFQKGDDQCPVRFFQKGDDQCPVSFFLC
jgi:hypothetical protein